MFPPPPGGGPYTTMRTVLRKRWPRHKWKDPTTSKEESMSVEEVVEMLHPFKPGDLVMHSDDGAIGMVTKLGERYDITGSTPGAWVIFGDGMHDQIPLTYLSLVDEK